MHFTAAIPSQCATTSDKAEEFEIICGSLEATSEFRRTEHLPLMDPEQSRKPGLCLDTLVLAELLEDALAIQTCSDQVWYDA